MKNAKRRLLTLVIDSLKRRNFQLILVRKQVSGRCSWLYIHLDDIHARGFLFAYSTKMGFSYDLKERISKRGNPRFLVVGSL